MSASKDKRTRKEQIAAGTDKRSNARAKEQAKQRKTNITYAVVGVLVVLFVAFVLFYNSTFMVRHTTAVTIDGKDYTAAQLNYYYSTDYMNFYSMYGNYVSMFFDTDESLADQSYDGDMSWRDYFLQDAAQNMAEIQMLNDQAEAAGFTLSEEQQADYDAEIENIQTVWQDLGYSNLQQYLNLNFGKGVDLELVKQEMYRSHVASAFSQSQYDSYEYDDETLDDYYAEHADELDVIDYAYYSIPVETEDTEDTEDTGEDAEAPEDAEEAEEPAEETEEVAEEAEEVEETEEPAEETEEPVEDAEETEEAAEEAEEPAEDAEDAEAAEAEAEETPEPSEETLAIAEAVDGTDEEAFAAYLEDNTDGEELSTESVPGASLSDAYSEWLLDAERQPGDAAAFATDSMEYVVMFLGRDTNDYPTVSFRHILVQAEDTDGDGVFGEEEIDAAADEAQSIYDEWKDGDGDEDSFAELANERSDDTGSNTNGGLYEGVAKGDMVEPINDWLFEDGRKAGDVTVVSYDGDNYTGTHVVYFVGQDDMSYAHSQADEALRSDDYDAWSEEQMASYVAVTSHLRMCGKNH